MFIFSGAVSRCSSEHNFIIRYVVFLACFLFSNAFLCNCPFELNYVQLLFTSLLEDIDAAFVSRDVTSTVSTAHAGISQVKHYFINQWRQRQKVVVFWTKSFGLALNPAPPPSSLWFAPPKTSNFLTSPLIKERFSYQNLQGKCRSFRSQMLF